MSWCRFTARWNGWTSWTSCELRGLRERTTRTRYRSCEGSCTTGLSTSSDYSVCKQSGKKDNSIICCLILVTFLLNVSQNSPEYYKKIFCRIVSFLLNIKYLMSIIIITVEC